MTDLPTESSSSPRSPLAQQAQGGNRLTIAHLLLWTTTTALFMAITAPPLQLVQGYSNAGEASFQQQIRVLQYIIVAISPFAGASIAAVVLAGWRHWRGGLPFPTQPGHWLLLLFGTGTSVRLVFAVVERVGFYIHPIGAGLMLAGYGVSLVLMAVMLAWAVKAVNEPRRWRLTFQVLAASFAGLVAISCCGLPLSGSQGLVLFAILYLCGPVSVLATAARDLSLRAEYDVFHWAGVVSVTAAALIIFAIPFLLWHY